jgi:hypothetical protein
MRTTAPAYSYAALPDGGFEAREQWPECRYLTGPEGRGLWYEYAGEQFAIISPDVWVTPTLNAFMLRLYRHLTRWAAGAPNWTGKPAAIPKEIPGLGIPSLPAEPQNGRRTQARRRAGTAAPARPRRRRHG